MSWEYKKGYKKVEKPEDWNGLNLDPNGKYFHLGTADWKLAVHRVYDRLRPQSTLRGLEPRLRERG